MGFFRKKEKTSSCCSGNDTPNTMEKAEKAKVQTGIKILGSGCAKCNELENHTKEAMSQLGMNEAIEHVTDFTQIAAYGVMMTPALVVDGKVVAYGRVLKTEEIKKLLERERKGNE